MIRKTFIAGAASLLLGVSGAEAAPIDLAALGFEEGTPSYSGSGGIFYDYDFQLLSADFISLDDFAGSDLFFFFDPFGPNTADVIYEPAGDLELFTITASGDNESDTLEFLLSRNTFDLTNGTIGVGPNAILRISSTDFDFSSLDPFDFFDQNSVDTGFGFLEYSADVAVTLTALERSAAVVPLPASLPLILAGLGAFAIVRRRRRS